MKTFRSLLLVSVILATGAVGRAQIYTVMRLTAPTGETITPRAVVDGNTSEKVRVVGEYVRGGKIHACLWTASSFLELPPLRGQATADVINSGGQIYGTDWDSNGLNPQLIGWNSSGAAFAPSPTGYQLLGAIAVNNSNAVVSNGYKVAPDGSQTEYGAYVLSGGATRLLPLSGDAGAESYAINDSGWAVGRSNGGVGSPVIWMGGVNATNLGTLGGTDGWAFGINNNNQAVGYSADSSGLRHAFLWQNGVMTQLPGGFSSAIANGINDSGVAVGAADRKAVSWSNGQMTDLNAFAPAADNVEFRNAPGISPNGAIIVTGDVIGSGGDAANYVLMPPKQVAIRADVNRDRVIRYDASDDSSASNPLRFWINSDRDVYISSDKDEEDADPAAGADYLHSKIAVKRDLEDFFPVELKAPSDLGASGTWEVHVRFNAMDQTPAVNLWRAVARGFSYLGDTKVADSQIAVTDKITLAAGGEIIVPLSWFQDDAQLNAKVAPLIVEGAAVGSGALVVTVLKNGMPLADTDTLLLQLASITDFYDHFTVGDNTTTDVTAIPLTATQISSVRFPDANNDYVLFVHGWRMMPWERRAFAETAFKRMWHQGYKGRFGLYSWPTDFNTVWQIILRDRQNYDRSEQRAWRSAFGLLALLKNLSTHYNVRMFAHSMGNAVASEALRLRTDEVNSTSVVSAYAACQAATVAHAYDHLAPATLRKPKTPNVYAASPPANQEYFAGIAQGGGLLFNLNNSQDYALGRGWLVNQKYKPDSGWGYSSSEYFFRVEASGSHTPLLFPDDRGEIFAHGAQAWSSALGRVNGVAGMTSVDLTASPFFFSNKPSNHSAEFNSTIMLRAPFWINLIDDFRINN